MHKSLISNTIIKKYHVSDICGVFYLPWNGCKYPMNAAQMMQHVEGGCVMYVCIKLHIERERTFKSYWENRYL